MDAKGDLESLQLAALLHDIGKFWQRTGQPPSGYEGLTKEDYGPHGAHAKWSAAFAEQFVPEDWQGGLYPVLYHHNPMDRSSKLIAVSDWLSAGERVKAERRAPSKLKSIFDSLQIKEIPAPSEEFYYPLHSLTLEHKSIFPKPGGAMVTEEDYKKAWKEFVDEVERIPQADFTAYFDTLYHVLQKHTWCVPSAYYQAVPDVSLFDHSRTTCAIATCLYKDGIEEGELNCLLDREEEAWRRPRILLVGGDVSGVQDFIYTLTSKGAAKGLRGRSFYLQLLSEAAAKWLLGYLDLPIANLLFAGGGHFYLLIPLGAREELEKAKSEISKRLLKIHRGDLYLAMAEVPLASDDFLVEKGKLSEKWHAITERLAEAKRLRFRELKAGEMHRLVFEPQGKGDWERVCAVCKNEGELDEEGKCTFCASFEELGGDIARAQRLVKLTLEKDGPAEGAKTWQEALEAFGTRVELGKDVDTEGALRATVYSLNETDLPEDPKLSIPTALGFRFLPQVVPRKDGGEIRTFTDLAKASKGGFKRLGVLRMDVDSLGLVFSEGLGERASISRISTLSSLLRLFFNGYLNEVCKGEGFEDRLYMTYSGGDDLFIVGSWDAMPELAWEINQEFGKFVCRNKNITISAGIALVPAKYPLYKAAEMARMALDEEAKGMLRKWDGFLLEKDAISFLGKPLGWGDFQNARELKEVLREMLNRGMPRGLLTRLRKIYDLYARNERAVAKDLLKPQVNLMKYLQRILYDKWRWRSVYNLHHLAKGHDEFEETLEKVREMIIKEGDEMIAYLDLPIRWAEFLTRPERGGENHGKENIGQS